ncbi:hypothetical protein MY3296_008752 [Beauveria thailandica]
MRTTFFAATAAMAGAATAAAANHRHAHHMFAKRGHAASTGFPIAATGEVCLPGCTTIWKTITGEATLIPNKVTTVTSTSTNTSTVTITSVPTPVSTPVQTVPALPTTTVVVVPTPEVQRCPTPGTYTFPATTMTVTDTTTVCGATTTKVPAGTHTIGGVTTVVTTLTTVTCPVATVVTSGGVTTSTIRMTEYVCPTAGTYIIGAHTTALSTETVIVYPTPTTIVPGTYTKPQIVVTATETNYVTVCPYTSSGLPTSTPTPSPVSTPAPTPAPVSSTATPSSVAPSSAAPSSAAPSSSAVPSSAAPSSSSAAPSSSAPATPGNSKTEVKGTNDHFAITYGPYDSSSGACKSASQVKKDISKIKAAGFQAVRIYGTDCDTLVNVVPACVSHGLQVIAGVFVRPGGQCSIENPEVKKQVDDLVAMNNWDAIRLLVIGNEAIMNHVCNASQLAKLIVDVKAQCSGYQGPVTIAETLNIWQQIDVSTAICPLVDVAGANIHAPFNPNVDASGAGIFVKGQMDILKTICNKNVINLETGWKNEGPCNGKACPGAQDQAKAISSIRKACGESSVLFSYDNEGWKPQDDQHWGLTDIFFSE